MCIRDSIRVEGLETLTETLEVFSKNPLPAGKRVALLTNAAVSYTHLRAHETVLDLVCRLLLEKKKYSQIHIMYNDNT